MAEPLRNQNQDETLVRARRQQIFAAACRVLKHKSFHEATVKEIALEARLAAGSIYVYLQSKDDILLLLAESMVAELAEMLPQIRGKSRGEPRRELLELMRAAIDVIDRYREAFCVLNQEVRYLARRPDYRIALEAKGVTRRQALWMLANQYGLAMTAVPGTNGQPSVICITNREIRHENVPLK